MQRCVRFNTVICVMTSLVCASLICVPSLVHATGSGIQEDPFRVPHTATQFTIDGTLDEPAWDGALALDVNIEVQPGENIPAPVNMTTYLIYR